MSILNNRTNVKATAFAVALILLSEAMNQRQRVGESPRVLAGFFHLGLEKVLGNCYNISAGIYGQMLPHGTWKSVNEAALAKVVEG